MVFASRILSFRISGFRPGPKLSVFCYTAYSRRPGNCFCKGVVQQLLGASIILILIRKFLGAVVSILGIPTSRSFCLRGSLLPPPPPPRIELDLKQPLSATAFIVLNLSKSRLLKCATTLLLNLIQDLVVVFRTEAM